MTASDNAPSIKISIVIPAYNEEESISPLFSQLSSVFPTDASNQVEFIFVDDGSTDRTRQEMSLCAQVDRRVRILHFERNLGKTVALAEAFKRTRGEIIATIDADLQNDPADIPQMIEKLAQGADLITGWRRRRLDGLDKTVPSKVINRLIRWFTTLTVHDINCGLKVFRREILENLQLFGKQHRYIPLKAHFSGYTVDEMVINHRPRRFGKSKYGVYRFFEGIFDLITILFVGKFDRSPFYLFGSVGLALFSLGSIILAYLSFGWLCGMWIASRPLFSAGILFVIFGFQLISIGLLAELILFLTRPDYNPKCLEIQVSGEGSEKAGEENSSPQGEHGRRKSKV